MRGVAAQEAAVPRAMVRELILELRTATALGGVTEREAQVLGMLRRGHSTAEIAARLQISPVTVRRYISDLVRKLGVDSRAGLLASTTARRLAADSTDVPEPDDAGRRLERAARRRCRRRAIAEPADRLAVAPSERVRQTRPLRTA